MRRDVDLLTQSDIDDNEWNFMKKSVVERQRGK